MYKNYNWSCQKVCEALVYRLDNIFLRFGTKIDRQTIGIPMGTNCAPLVADLFLFCYEKDFIQAFRLPSDPIYHCTLSCILRFKEIIKYCLNQVSLTRKSGWHYWSFQIPLPDTLSTYYIDDIYFQHMVDRVYPDELQLNKANSSDTEAPCLDLNWSISNGTVSTKIYDKRDDFDFDIVISSSSMVMSLSVLHMECTYLSLFVSLEHPLT